jgi:hypothetical protein
MTSLKQIEANRRNALKSTGPRTAGGKLRSRQNAVRHGLTAQTVITAFENAADYEQFELSIMADYQPHSATQRELAVRLASVLWRLRRSTLIETGLFEMQGELYRNRAPRRRTVPPPDWYDELDAGSTITGFAVVARDHEPKTPDAPASADALATCYLQVSRLGDGAFDLLSRYEAALWRQAAQIFFMLQSTVRRPR